MGMNLSIATHCWNWCLQSCYSCGITPRSSSYKLDGMIVADCDHFVNFNI